MDEGKKHENFPLIQIGQERPIGAVAAAATDWKILFFKYVPLFLCCTRSGGGGGCQMESVRRPSAMVLKKSGASDQNGITLSTVYTSKKSVGNGIPSA